MPLYYTVTNTTRACRPGESDGKPYRFVGMEDFERLLERDELLEHAVVYGNHYGVPKSQVREALAAGKDVILKIDVQGAMTIKKLLPDATLIFLMPPSLAELARRLGGRKTETPEELELRLATARAEIAKLSEFHYVVTNRDIRQSLNDISAIIAAEKLRVAPRRYHL